MSSSAVHQASTAGYDGNKSEVYDKARHQYTTKQLAYMYSTLSKKNDLNVAEIGAGTGLFTRALLADAQWSKELKALKCVEPLQGMRDVFSQNIQDPRVSISSGMFEKSDVPDEWADVIIAATAFHWCNDLEAGVKELNRILKPDGTIILVWQIEDRDKRWVEEMWSLGMSYQSATGKTTLHFKEWPFRRVFDLPSYKTYFREPQEEYVKYSTEGTLDILTTRFMTWSVIATLSDEEKVKVAGKLAALVEKGEDLVWFDKEKGLFDIPMATPVILIRRK